MNRETGPEADRQLGEQRANADALASRAGLMLGVSAALLAIAAEQATAIATSSKLGYWLVGIAAVLGVLIFWTARVSVGPSPSSLALTSPDELVRAKVLLVEANSRVLLRVQVLFTGQVLLTIAGVAVLYYMMWGLP